MHNNVHNKRHRCTNLEREYVKGIVHNLSFQRWTDQQIADHLSNENQIEISRSTVTRIKSQVERKAEKWYIELKQTSYKYIALYKERIDSLFYYQKILHSILEGADEDETKLSVIKELHSIEMSIFNLWKQLPSLDIVDTSPRPNLDSTGSSGVIPDQEDKEEERRQRTVYFGWKEGDPPLDNNFRARMEEKYGRKIEPWDMPGWIQCPECKRYFKTGTILDSHTCTESEACSTKLH